MKLADYIRIANPYRPNPEELATKIKAGDAFDYAFIQSMLGLNSEDTYICTIGTIADTSYYFSNRIKDYESEIISIEELSEDLISIDYIFSEIFMDGATSLVRTSLLLDVLLNSKVKVVFTSTKEHDGMPFPPTSDFGVFMSPNLFHMYYTIQTFHIIPIAFDDTILLFYMLKLSDFDALKFSVERGMTFEQYSKFKFTGVVPTTCNSSPQVRTNLSNHLTRTVDETIYNDLTICPICGSAFLSLLVDSPHCSFCVDIQSCFDIVNEGGDITGDCRRCGRSKECLRHIFQYNENPNTTFWHNDGEKTTEEKDTTYYGVELELEYSSPVDYEDEEKHTRHYNEVKGYGDDEIKFIYAKYDGSLDYGYEIVTQPAEFDYLKNEMKRVIDRALSLGSTSHNNGRCGLHIHINKKSLNDLSLANIMQIMYSNWEDFVVFSRRQVRQLDWCRKVYLDGREDNTPSKIIGKTENSEKYVAVNILHKNSVELRLFRGTLRYNTFVATLQLVDNLIKLAKSLSLTKAQECSFKDVVLFNYTDELKQYIEERGIDLDACVPKKQIAVNADFDYLDF